MTKLHFKYHEEPWFPEILSYLSNRYPAIESRMMNTFRYVQLHETNRYTFSYEFGSVLRDVCSVFGSLTDRLVRLTTSGSLPKRLNFGHYRTFLVDNVPNIPSQTVNVRGLDAGVLIPFRELGSPRRTPKWWDAYNNLKHSEILNYQDGNLENTLNSLGALAILGFLLGTHGFTWGIGSSPLFNSIGIVYPKDSIDVTQNLLFKKEV